MADFKILRTDHTSFTVSDPDRSPSFHCDVLGIKQVSKAGRDPAIIRGSSVSAAPKSIVAHVKGPDDHQAEPLIAVASARSVETQRLASCAASSGGASRIARW